MQADRVEVEARLPMVRGVTRDQQRRIDGTLHKLRKKHLQAYLNELMFRFGHRFHGNLSHAPHSCGLASSKRAQPATQCPMDDVKLTAVSDKRCEKNGAD